LNWSLTIFWEFGGYLGTFGSYDRDAVRRCLRGKQML
jgi:hypothetical protein